MNDSDPARQDTASSQTPPPHGALSDDKAAFQKLDPRVVRLWRLTRSIGFSILAGVLLIVMTFFGLAIPGIWVVLLAIWGAVALLMVWWIVRYPPLAYRAWAYRLDEKVFEARQGVIFTVTHLLPLSRLQHVDLHRGPLDRMHGLSSLVLYTAGTQAATLVIPGLDATVAVQLRDHLVEVGGDDGV